MRQLAALLSLWSSPQRILPVFPQLPDPSEQDIL